MARTPRRRTAARATAGAAVLGLALLGTAAPAFADHEGDLFAVDINNQFYRFAPSDVSTIKQSAPIVGLQNGEVVLGIDFRPSDGEIYGITQNNRIYRIDYRSGDFGTAVFVSQLGNNAKVNGTNFGVNFNPVADQLRVVSDTGQNLRINVDTGATVVDTPLAYVSGDPNVGKAPHVTAVAYTHPDNDPNTGTELFDIDPGQPNQFDIISKQDPANSGTLTTRGNTGANNGNLIGLDFDLNGKGYASVVNTDVAAKLVTITFDNDPATNDTPIVTQGPTIATPELRDLAVGIPDDGVNPFGGPTPVVPELPLAALAPVAAVVVGGALLARRRRTT